MFRGGKYKELIMMGTCQLICFKCVWLKNIGEVITSWLINEITPFSQFDLVLLSMPITGTLV